ncbi:helix-turn-helix transcriptional regulator [Streptomyces sp. NBC_00102]|uniref:helix-turn-helix domain-containing protein n=1 Tax=Streptomyces sp. NBC_00102 TaxID=2975652 RepID=UPI002253ED7B|nr:helix-turn-helix transcriptional regulator [Streptomyces sp. NBC_00102]MCX5398030.1 helix-turn-helix transcriptional regulator [Streptomyces sp. NBC_00102]
MATNSTPTARRRRLGAELRKLRERAGITATEAAVLLGGNQARISNIEAGRYGVSADRVRALSRHYACTDRGLVEALAAMTGERRSGWWEEYRDGLPNNLLDLAELEHHGTALRATTTCTVPDLLQTVDHAREALTRAAPELSPPEVEQRLSFRIRRQEVVFRAEAVPYRAVVHEAALHMGIGRSRVAGPQLRHLLAMSERETVTLRVIPFASGGLPGTGQPLTYVQGSVAQLDTVHLEQAHGLAQLDAEPILQTYRQLLDRLESMALDARASRALLHKLASAHI